MGHDATGQRRNQHPEAWQPFPEMARVDTKEIVEIRFAEPASSVVPASQRDFMDSRSMSGMSI